MHRLSWHWGQWYFVFLRSVLPWASIVFQQWLQRSAGPGRNTGQWPTRRSPVLSRVSLLVVCEQGRNFNLNKVNLIFSILSEFKFLGIPYLRWRWTPSKLRSFHPQPRRGASCGGAIGGRGSSGGSGNWILQNVLLRFDDRRRFHHDRGAGRSSGELRIRVLPVYPIISTAWLLLGGQERVGMLLHQVGRLRYGQQVRRGGHCQQAGLVHQNRLRRQRGNSRFVQAFRRLGQAERWGRHVNGGGNDVRGGRLAVRRQVIRLLLDAWLAQQTIPLRTYLLRVNNWNGRGDLVNC